ncbi:DUF2971 domain-containing protein [Shewanella mangrovisoli]|uniref:DUF2971 domain-containing protein n=1 Tax=Shewanella mangrovisoli TaxID=2864211 RepID=UPI0035B8E747
MKFIYKYMSEVAAISFLKDPWIRVTPKAALNDPFECRPTQLTKERIVKKFKGQKSLSTQPNLIIHNFEGVMDYFGIVSLSKSFNDLLMWSHYADSHKGLMLEFDLDEIKKLTILYDDKIEDNVQYTHSRAFEGVGNSLNEIRRHYFLSKSPPWGYENEYRLVLPINLNMKVAFDQESKESLHDMKVLGFSAELSRNKSRFTEKYSLTHLNESDFDKLCDVWLNSSQSNTQFYQYIGYKALNRIYLGANSNIDLFKMLFDELSETPDPYRTFKSIITDEYNGIYHMKLDPDKYELIEQQL